MLTAVLLLTGLAQANPGGTPTATLQTKNGQFAKMLRGKVNPVQVKQLASSLLDYDELTRRAMADHWQQINDKQRKELVDTLRELIQRRYVDQVKSNLDYQVSYKDEQVAGDDATVNSIVKVKTRGKSTDAEIVYKMRKVTGADGTQWMVWDVITDEVSLMRNYKTQFHRIITDSGFDELLRKMKKKVAEKDKESADKAEKEKT
jgi:phospholipid transport system substrate-binding protein